MQKVSVRTLTLMVVLLLAVIAHQHVDWAPVAHADVMWLAGDDPNEPSEPVPEVSDAALGQSFLDDDPNEPSEPVPEVSDAALGQSFLDDDPNEPSEPVPEVA